MKTLILYYSYTGNTQKIAEELAAKESADIVKIEDARRPGTLKAFSLGCLAALYGKSWETRPLTVKWEDYNRFILLFPVWAGNPAPAANAVWKHLPAGASVVVKMVSASGFSNCQERVKELIQAQGCTLESFEDIK